MTKSIAKTFNKSDFFNLRTVVETVSIPEMGGDIGIKSMTAAEREGLERRLQKEQENNGIRATVFIYSVCDLEGKLLFNEEDLEAVKTLPNAVVSKIFNASNILNGITAKEEAEAAKN